MPGCPTGWLAVCMNVYMNVWRAGRQVDRGDSESLCLSEGLSRTPLAGLNVLAHSSFCNDQGFLTLLTASHSAAERARASERVGE